MKPGWGVRHPELAALLASAPSVQPANVTWAKGTLPLRISAYPWVTTLPDELVISVRCLVQVGDLVVVCTNADGISHPWPGGRREPGETYEVTACREVHEETGWLVDPTSLRPLGWLHLEHLEPRPADWPYPHPDFLQLVYAGRTTERAGDDTWTDTEGYELSSCLMSVAEAHECVGGDPLSRPFLDLLD